MHLGSSKFAFRLCETLGRTVFPAQGHTKRISGGYNLRFACAEAELAGAQLGAKEQSDKLLVLRVLSFYIQALFL